MSRLRQRKEKNCLNCDTQVIGIYCHVCGQENTEPKESVWHLITHFFNDITHFDGKFFTSLKDLILKPGYLSKEYVAGRRARFLNPIRMYLFTSALFFLIFFSFKDDNSIITINSNQWGVAAEEINKMDSAQLVKFTKRINNGKPLTKAQLLARIDTDSFTIGPGNYRTKEEYDSVLKTGKKKHNWLERQMVYKNIELKQKYNSNPKLILPALSNKLLHYIPQMLFVLLPIFALILKLVYVRRKQFYYVDHVIFTIHFYIFIFLAMLVSFSINKLKGFLHWDWLNYLLLIFVVSIFFYFYKALRNFYKQRRAKTVMKYFILVLSFIIISLVTFVIFFFFSMLGL